MRAQSGSDSGQKRVRADKTESLTSATFPVGRASAPIRILLCLTLPGARRDTATAAAKAGQELLSEESRPNKPGDQFQSQRRWRHKPRLLHLTSELLPASERSCFLVLPGTPSQTGRVMSHDPNEAFDHAVLDFIDHSSNGAVPFTPAYQDALRRLDHAHQVYPSADYARGYVTARSLSGLRSFWAENLDALLTEPQGTLESNAKIFERYVKSLKPELQAKAQALQLTVAGKPALHRAKHGIVVAHDPIHTLFLVPGAGIHPGLPGNYLYGYLAETNVGGAKGWSLHLHDREDGDARWQTESVNTAVQTLHELIETAPFHLRELEAFGFTVS